MLRARCLDAAWHGEDSHEREAGWLLVAEVFGELMREGARVKLYAPPTDPLPSEEG